MPGAQQDIDALNADFWDELCGSSLARQLGITEITPEALVRFDREYMRMYPYLEAYLPQPVSDGDSLLEVGLGFGTVGQRLVERGFRYRGVDISPGPVEVMRERLARVALQGDPSGPTPREDGCEARVASALELPFGDAAFDHVVSIGCLHHTGDIAGSVAELSRVLRPGGRALVMLYNSRSARQLVRLRPGETIRRLRGARGDGARMRAAYDTNEAGEAAPVSEFVSRREARRLFARFSDVTIRAENFDPIRVRGQVVVPRERLLGNLARLAGLDLYVVARR